MIFTSLDETIAKALEGLRRATTLADFDPPEYIKKFENSAKEKARGVLKSLKGNPNCGFRNMRPIFLSIGGGDGAEIEALLSGSDAKLGILVEGDRRIAEMARDRKAKLWRTKKKKLDVWQANAADAHVIEEAINEITDSIIAQEGDFIAVTCHAVIHELFDRSRTKFTPATFFGAIFNNYEIPIWFRYREPGVPPTWGDDAVLVSAECNPSSLVELAKEICLRHPSLKELLPEPSKYGESVRLHADLAMELISKVFYLEDLAYEIEERITAGKHFKLIDEVSCAMRVPPHLDAESAVVPEYFSSASFAELCQKYKVKVLVADQKANLGIPTSHTQVTAWRCAVRLKEGHSGGLVGSKQGETAPHVGSMTGTDKTPSGLSAFEVQPFDLAVDGLTVNCVGELIVDDPETGDIRRKCHESYLQSLEDFAFATVYGGRVLTSRSFRPNDKMKSQPGVELISQLGEIAEVHQLAPEVVGGALLKSGPNRKLVADHIECLSDCLSDSTCIPIFKDWMVRESKKYLGDDQSLFDEDLPADNYKFKVALSYYADPQLQGMLSQATVKTLIGFLPERPSKGEDRFANSALKEFVTRNALSLVTIMLEYDISAETRHFWRLPHLIRRHIKRQYWKRHGEAVQNNVSHQERLRRIVVRHALVTALEKGLVNRAKVVSALLGLRDEPEFKATREQLNELGLLHLHPGAENELKAKAILTSMYSSDVPLTGLDQVLLHRSYLVFRSLKESTISKYERGLYRAFPELRPPD
jgi:hypothetical protein